MKNKNQAKVNGLIKDDYLKIDWSINANTNKLHASLWKKTKNFPLKSHKRAFGDKSHQFSIYEIWEEADIAKD
jgi:hypothetical protein